jgi:hypothetical protein
MKKDKFLTAREKKIKSIKEKADALYNNLSHEDLSNRNSTDHISRKIFKLLVKYSPYANAEYNKENFDKVLEFFFGKQFEDKISGNKSMPPKEIEKKGEENIIPNSITMTKGKPIPYASGLTPEYIEKNRHLVRPCDPNKPMEKKEKQSNGFVYAKFEGY